jgi:hypothetical protein
VNLWISIAVVCEIAVTLHTLDFIMALAVVFLSFLSFLLHLRVFTQIAVIDCVFIHYHHYVSSHCHITLRSTNSQTAQVGLSTSILPTTISLSFARSTVTVRPGLSTSVSSTTFNQSFIVLDQTSKPVTPISNANNHLQPRPLPLPTARA